FTSKQEALEAAQLIPKIKSRILPLGIDIGLYQKGYSENFLKTYPEARGKKCILFLSRIDPKKGLEILIPAFAAIYPFHKDSLLIIAGDGLRSYVQSLKALAFSLALKNEILWTGFLSGQEKLDALAASHVFVLPSQSENFGIAAVEALASGLPVITGRGVAISEWIVAYRAGYVVEEHTTKDYTQALRKVLIEDTSPMRQAALKLAKEQFSLEKMGSNLLTLYRSILQEK
ncbi:MAG: glycosyltransferase, partial [Methylacidiphilales bacterium]|nr:glycosyltransferase [Candidatus Methylacidiphilales bacterium]